MCRVSPTVRAVSWMANTLQVGSRSWLGTVVNCGGTNFPTVWVSLFMESLFAAECALPRETTRSERETTRSERER